MAQTILEKIKAYKLVEISEKKKDTSTPKQFIPYFKDISIVSIHV